VDIKNRQVKTIIKTEALQIKEFNETFLTVQQIITGNLKLILQQEKFSHQKYWKFERIHNLNNFIKQPNRSQDKIIPG